MRTSYIIQQQLQLVLMLLNHDNRLVCQVMLHTGLRVSDVLNLKRSQIGRRFTVRESKTGKIKRCGLPDWLSAEIIRRAGGSEWAFPSPRDRKKHRTRQAVWKDIKRVTRYGKLVTGNAGTHSMRKVYAVDLMQKYHDVKVVQRALNHENEAVTALYALADHFAETAPLRRSVRPRR